MIYLYLKTHNKTGLKYLGKTISDPYKYQGSGKVWKRHINKHGYDVTTTVLYQCEDKEEFKKFALEYSKKLNIVESKEFANIVPEAGDGGPQLWTESSRLKLSKSLTGAKRNKGSLSKRHKESLSKSQKEFLSNEEMKKEHMRRLHSSENRIKASQTMSSLKWCNDGIRNYRLKVIPNGYQAGRL